jgi:hypothetical protein
MAFSINMDKAKELHINKIRQKRTELFVELDVQFMKSLEQGNQTLTAEIAAIKETLRNLPNADLSGITNIEELKSNWNIEILGESPYK